jgi:hypothetical protein
VQGQAFRAVALRVVLHLAVVLLVVARQAALLLRVAKPGLEVE